MFGPQKGAKANDLELLDECVASFVQLVCHSNGRDFQEIAQLEGAGACGGIVASFKALMGDQCQIVSGFDYTSRLLDLEKLVGECDLVITGEGRYD